MSAIDEQVEGSHYKKLKIQPVTYIHANKIGYLEGNVIKYITRWREKNGVVDLQKAKHYIELLIELEEKYAPDARQLDKGLGKDRAANVGKTYEPIRGLGIRIFPEGAFRV